MELTGTIIKEALENDAVLDYISVENVELWPTADTPRYWTAIHFTTEDVSFPSKLSKVMRKDWFCDMNYGDRVKVLVFHRKVLQYTIGNTEEKRRVLEYCERIGVPSEMTQWAE